MNKHLFYTHICMHMLIFSQVPLHREKSLIYVCSSFAGDLLLSLASKYQKSTFVNLMDSEEVAESLYEEVKKRNLSNLVITALPDGVDDSFTLKLVESPEFLRYQFIGEIVTSDNCKDVDNMCM